MSTIFSRIISGEIPCHRVAEDDRFLAFLDIVPVAAGHTLVIPKKEIDYIFDMNAEEFAAFHLFAQQVAIKIKNSIPCIRVGMAVVGLEVPHAHIHLIPLNSMSDMNFQKERLKISHEELSKFASAISAG